MAYQITDISEKLIYRFFLKYRISVQMCRLWPRIRRFYWLGGVNPIYWISDIGCSRIIGYCISVRNNRYAIPTIQITDISEKLIYRFFLKYRISVQMCRLWPRIRRFYWLGGVNPIYWISDIGCSRIIGYCISVRNNRYAIPTI